MPDYSRGKIYKIVSENTDRFYIGSTTYPLEVRFNGHLSNYKKLMTSPGESYNIKSSLMFMYGNAHIELIENFPCNSKAELETREKQYIEKYKDNVVNEQFFPSVVSDQTLAVRLHEKESYNYIITHEHQDTTKNISTQAAKIDIKNYECNRCSKQFKLKTDLERHSKRKIQCISNNIAQPMNIDNNKEISNNHIAFAVLMQIRNMIDNELEKIKKLL